MQTRHPAPARPAAPEHPQRPSPLQRRPLERRPPGAPRVGPPPTGRRRMVRRALAGHADTDFRPDIEGLRAIAVLAVVLYHVRLPGVRGGFVGVDVFFVVSGFLITRLLLAELATTGTVSRQRLLGPPGPPHPARRHADGGRHRGARAQRAGAARAAGARRRRHRRRHVHDQLRVRPPPRRLLRRPARRHQPVAAPALLVARGRGAVLPPLAGAAGAAHPPAGAVPPAARRHRGRARRDRLRRRDVAHRPTPVVGVLPPAGPHGRAPRRRRAAPSPPARCSGCPHRCAPRSGGPVWPGSWSPARCSTSRCPGRGGPCCCRCSPRWR